MKDSRSRFLQYAIVVAVIVAAILLGIVFYITNRRPSPVIIYE